MRGMGGCSREAAIVDPRAAAHAPGKNGGSDGWRRLRPTQLEGIGLVAASRCDQFAVAGRILTSTAAKSCFS
jgi:hypothetical protein